MINFPYETKYTSGSFLEILIDVIFFGQQWGRQNSPIQLHITHVLTKKSPGEFYFTKEIMKCQGKDDPV